MHRKRSYCRLSLLQQPRHGVRGVFVLPIVPVVVLILTLLSMLIIPFAAYFSHDGHSRGNVAEIILLHRFDIFHDPFYCLSRIKGMIWEEQLFQLTRFQHFVDLLAWFIADIGLITVNLTDPVHLFHGVFFRTV